MTTRILQALRPHQGELLRALVAFRGQETWDTVWNWTLVANLRPRISSMAFMRTHAARSIRSYYVRVYSKRPRPMQCSECGRPCHGYPPPVRVRSLASDLVSRPSLARFFAETPPGGGIRLFSGPVAKTPGADWRGLLLWRKVSSLWRDLNRASMRVFKAPHDTDPGLWWLCGVCRLQRPPDGRLFYVSHAVFQDKFCVTLAGLFTLLLEQKPGQSVFPPLGSCADDLFVAIRELRALLADARSICFVLAGGSTPVWRMPEELWRYVTCSDHQYRTALYKAAAAIAKGPLCRTLGWSLFPASGTIYLTADGSDPQRLGPPPPITARWGPRKRKRTNNNNQKQ